MLTPSSPEYVQTKQIMLDNAQMPAELQPLADWIDETFGVRPVNIVRDSIDGGTKPRLGIIFETKMSAKCKDLIMKYYENKQRDL